MRIALIGNNNGGGLSADMTVIQRECLAAGHSVSRFGVRWSGFSREGRPNFEFAGSVGEEFDLSITFETPLRADVPARHRALLANPEWLDPSHESRILGYDCILTKLPAATEVMKKWHPNVVEVLFESPAAYGVAAAAGVDRGFFCLAGQSPLKEAARLAEVWADHPSWPPLFLVMKTPPERALSRATPGHIVYRAPEYPAPRDLREDGEACGYHLCLSLTEGWGHNLFEALGSGHVPIFNDAPPYQGFLDDSGAIPVGALRRSEDFGLSPTYEFEVSALESTIETLIEEGEDAWRVRSQQGISFCRSLGREFRRRLRGWLAHLDSD